MSSFDKSLFLDVNRFAIRTGWAHWFMRGYADYAGLVILALIVILAWWRARGGAYGGGSRARVADVLVVPIAALVAFALNQPLTHIVGRARPFAAIHQHVEVLVPRAHDFGFPSDHATLAGAVIVGVWLCRDRMLGVLATLAGLFLAFARVYVGVHYPGDVVAGLLFGGVVVAAVRIPLLAVLAPACERLAGAPALRWFVGGTSTAAAHGPGPAARPEVIAQSGAVRILESGAKPVPHVDDPDAVPVARRVPPARPHVLTSRRRPQPADSDLRDAGESGRRGAAGSAGDL